MANHMKTTVHIADALLSEAQAIASREKMTLKALIQEGLQDVLAKRRIEKPFVLEDGSFPPAGAVKEKVPPRDWSEIVSLVYGDRGG